MSLWDFHVCERVCLCVCVFLMLSFWLLPLCLFCSISFCLFCFIWPYLILLPFFRFLFVFQGEKEKVWMEREARRAWEELGEAKPQSEYIVWKKKKSIFNRRKLERKKRMLSKEDRPNAWTKPISQNRKWDGPSRNLFPCWLWACRQEYVQTRAMLRVFLKLESCCFQIVIHFSPSRI